MTKIDTSEWGEFVFGKLFEMQSQKEISPIYAINNSKKSDIRYPFIGQSSENNGIISYIYLEDDTLLNNVEGDIAIIIHSNNHLSFCIDTPFYLKDGHGATSIFKNEHLNEHNVRFVITVLNKTMENLFDYDVKATKDSLKKLIIKLPITSTGEPNWGYMESYMQRVVQEIERGFENLKQIVNGRKQKTNTASWEKFTIGSLFDVIKGVRLTKAHMVSGKTRFIGSSALHNGCTALIGNTENVHRGNLITVCYNGSVGEAFYQDKPFCASDDVNVLYPKFNMSREIALFLVPLIKSISKKYNYNDKWKQEIMILDKIELPTTNLNQPDWNYMEQYMSRIMRASEEIVGNYEMLGL